VCEGFKVIIFKLSEAWEVDIVVNELRRGGLGQLGILLFKYIAPTSNMDTVS